MVKIKSLKELEELRSEKSSSVKKIEAKEGQLILNDLGQQTIDSYIGSGGYEGLGMAIHTMKDNNVITIIKSSGLRGRGGSGFPTGSKWEAVAGADDSVKYVICNGNEGDPRINSDEMILREMPHKIIEAMVIAGYAVGSHKGYIYLPSESKEAVENLKAAICEAQEYGFLGENVFGSDFRFSIELFTGLAAFVAGEETAMMAVMEDGRPMPEQRPLYPSKKGLWGHPTLINNVETLANIPNIIAKGNEVFKSVGTSQSPETMLFSLGGRVAEPGIYELPLGTTLGQAIEAAGGVAEGKAFKAAQVGGPTGAFVVDLEVSLDFDTLEALGGMLGSGSIHVLDENDQILETAKFFMNYIVDSSCGKCSPCREGTKRMEELMGYILDGEATETDYEDLKEMAEVIKETSLCGLGQSAPDLVLSTIAHFEEEYTSRLKQEEAAEE